MRVDRKGRDIKLHTEGDGESMEMNGFIEEKQMNENEQRTETKWTEEEK